MFMYLGASTTSPKRMSNVHNFHSDGHNDGHVGEEEEEEFDELGTAILRRGSNPRNIVVDRDHRKDEELAFCKSMACLLTQTRDLPRLCHSFPTVVRSVGNRNGNGGPEGGGGGEEDTTASDSSDHGGGMTSIDSDSSQSSYSNLMNPNSNHYNQTIVPVPTTTHLGTSSAAAFASSYHPIGFAAAGSVSFNSDTSDATTTSSSGFPYYESIPPHSDR